MTVTFVDSGVLIAGSRGQGDVARRALAILIDPEREFGSSDFIELEVLPKPTFYKRHGEVQFLELFFRRVARWAEPADRVVDFAHSLAVTYGLAGMDALHVAAAILIGADELVTTERPATPIHRVRELPIVSIHV